MTIYADEYLGVFVPKHLMGECDYHSDGGHGYKIGSVYELYENETADYMIQNRTSDLAQHFESEYGIDLDDRAEVIRQIESINKRMGEMLD